MKKDKPSLWLALFKTLLGWIILQHTFYIIIVRIKKDPIIIISYCISLNLRISYMVLNCSPGHVNAKLQLVVVLLLTVITLKTVELLFAAVDAVLIKIEI